ncbi:hypothetical protein Ahy_A09g044837 [Arachis hypogaea]|uniref:PB1-like domain-containing protein n=1 Tax=Arachis hypogaea TaxID=3818 RepID=A0A445BKW5_ARAHY|nr:hypothetical protein Ahy_A09g044837 [Arachis hypogaea]
MPHWKPGWTPKTTLFLIWRPNCIETSSVSVCRRDLICSDYFSLKPTQSLPLLIFFNGASLRGIFAALLSQRNQAYCDYFVSITHVVFMCVHEGLGIGMGLIIIVCHHGGSFVRSEDSVVSYTRDHISEIPKLDPDRLDVFFIRNYYKELRYDKTEHCWWLVPNRPLETGLR